jgi:hypothetical protein
VRPAKAGLHSGSQGELEPWYIAMDRGIENMFSDFKSRGFSLMQTHIHFADRLKRLILILSIALHWAVSLGLNHEKHNQDHAEKRVPKASRSQLSLFKRGLRFLRRCCFLNKTPETL